jgi:hypothetical protein
MLRDWHFVLAPADYSALHQALNAGFCWESLENRRDLCCAFSGSHSPDKTDNWSTTSRVGRAIAKPTEKMVGFHFVPTHPTLLALCVRGLSFFEKKNSNLESIQINPKTGIGKPEPLKHELSGC